MQRSRWESPLVSSLTARNVKTRRSSLTPDDRSVPPSTTPYASWRSSRRWSRILSDHRPLITDHHPGRFSQWHIRFLGPRVPLRTVHVAICCWCHWLPMTDRITSPPVSSCTLVFSEETKWSSSVATWTPVFALLIFKTCAPPLFLYLLQHSSLNFRSLSLRVPSSSISSFQEPLAIIKRYPFSPSMSYLNTFYWLHHPITVLCIRCGLFSLSQHCTRVSSGFSAFFCVFTSSSSSLLLLHFLQTIAFSFSSPSSCFSLNPVFHWSLIPSFLSPL